MMPQARSIPRTCLHCGASFLARPNDVKVGKGNHCSMSCAQSRVMRARLAVRPQNGANNPNYRGGRASRPYESYVRRFKQANPEKARAHQLVSYAVSRGKLKRPETCSRCGGRGPIHGHHTDYAQPLAVTWVCRPCHHALHREADLQKSA